MVQRGRPFALAMATSSRRAANRIVIADAAPETEVPAPGQDAWHEPGAETLPR